MIRPVFSTNINYTLRDKEFFKEVVVSMYPNPATNEFNLVGLPDNAVITLYDLSGREVYSAFNETRISIGFLQTGIYIVDVKDESDTSVFTEKLIKQ